MNENDIANKLKGFFSGRSSCAELTLQSPLRNHLDSIAMLEFIVFIEQEFAISVNDGDVTPKNFANLSAIATYICSKTYNA
jgi:acyl carrier protein